MRNISSKNRLVTAAVTLLVLGVVGMVYAQWVTTGSGSGYAKAGTAKELSTNNVSADVSTAPADLLYPGGTGAVLIQVHNPNPYPVKVTKISAGTGSIVASGGKGTCTVTGVSLNGEPTVSIEVPAESDSGKEKVSGAAKMSGASETGCQEATFTIPVKLTAASSAE
jgi:hypothetical protein